ncbi:MAG: hypothetical protein K6E61_03290 [Bacteroidales bacterium]|nr:hypothetical protein [Bacteroidales bacterium]
MAVRTLPHGDVRKLQPFHVCIKGLEDAILCRDDEDYDAMVKIICVSAWRHNVIVIIYTVLSNHCHIAVLAERQDIAQLYGNDVKKVFSMWYSRKYGERNILKRIDLKALWLDTEWYVRNVLAYIPRNALDNGCNVNEYIWSGYRAMFNKEKPTNVRKVCLLTSREKERIMHTGDNLSRVPWTIDANNLLEPYSFCDSLYLEQVFNNDQAYFLKMIGSVNTVEMQYDLEERPYLMLPDTELFKSVEELAQKWFSKSVDSLSQEQKNRLIPFLLHTRKTTPKQLARVLGIPRERMPHIPGFRRTGR